MITTASLRRPRLPPPCNPLDIEDQSDWPKIIENSALSVRAFCATYDFQRQSLMKWLDGTTEPRKANRERMTKALKKLLKTPRLTRDPSYGYASREQIEQLRALGIGPARSTILEKIDMQNKLEGKIA